MIVAWLVEKTNWGMTEIYSLRLPRLWRIMAGFKKLGEGGTGSDEVEPTQAPSAALHALGSYGRERTFDNLPLEIQAWSRRCRGLEN